MITIDIPFCTFLECADRAVGILIWKYVYKLSEDGPLIFSWYFTKICKPCWNVEVIWLSCYVFMNFMIMYKHRKYIRQLRAIYLYTKRAILYSYKLPTFKLLSSANNGSVWVLGGTPWIIRTIFFCNMINLIKWLWYVKPHTCIQYVKYGYIKE